MLSIVSWNICRRRAAWDELLRMRDEEGIDFALLQEVGKYVPEGVERGDEDWDWSVCDRWPAVVRLSDRVKVEWFKAAPLYRPPQAHEFAVSDIRTIAAAKVTPLQDGQPSGEPFIAASMYSFWLFRHPLAGKIPAYRRRGRGSGEHLRRRFDAPHHLRPLSLHRPYRPVGTPYPCHGRHEYVLRLNRRRPRTPCRRVNARCSTGWLVLASNTSGRSGRTPPDNCRQAVASPMTPGTFQLTTP